MPRLVTFAIRAACALALALLVASPVVAHAELDTATPGPDDVVTDLPDELVATFTQDIDGSRSSIDIIDANDEVLAIGGKDPDEPRTMRLDLPKLAPGTYTVRWTTWSADDGELARGTYSITVEAAPATPSPTPTTAPSTSPSASPTSSASPSPTASAAPSATRDGGSADGAAAVVPIAVAVAVAAGLAAWLVRSRAR